MCIRDRVRQRDESIVWYVEICECGKREGGSRGSPGERSDAVLADIEDAEAG